MTTATPTCASPCGIGLSTLNLINGESVHEDCRCFYRECRTPLADALAWQRHICNDCWPCNESCGACQADPGHRAEANRHNVASVRLRPLPRVAA
jgi:hypothetical protein